MANRADKLIENAIESKVRVWFPKSLGLNIHDVHESDFFEEMKKDAYSAEVGVDDYGVFVEVIVEKIQVVD